MRGFTPLRDPDPVDRLAPPGNIEAEQALLGAILISNVAYHRVAEFLRPEHFLDSTADRFSVHGRLYRACGELIDAGVVADPVSLKHRFENDPALTLVGGGAYLARLAASAVTIVNAVSYARTIVDLAVRRQAILAAEDLADSLAQEFSRPVDELLGAHDARLSALLGAGGRRNEVDLGMAIAASLERTQEAYRNQGSPDGLTAGLVDLDRMLGGFVLGDLVVIAGRPAMGKTALLVNILEGIVRNPRGGSARPVGLLSLEQSAAQLARRVLARETGVSSQRQRRGDMALYDWNDLVAAQARLSSVPLWIDDTPGLTLGQVRQRAQAWKRQYGIVALGLDHLQLMQAERHGEGRARELSEITAGLKTIAKQLDIVVFLLSQLSRQVEGREDKRPQLSDLRESGSTEQDADVVMLLFREEYYLAKSEPRRRDNEADDHFNDRYDRWKERCDATFGTAEVILDKVRDGPSGVVRLHWDGERSSFDNHIGPEHLPDSTD